MSGVSSKVVCCKQLDGLWERVEREGWLDLDGRPPHVVVQIGQAGRSTAVVATVTSLVARLHAKAPGTRVEILDQAASPDDWHGVPVRRVVAEDTLRVAALAVPQGLVLPRLWFESFVLITVAGVSPSPTSRVASLFEAQADPLFQLANSGVPAALVYEAHRLAASDLAIVCCPTGPQLGAAGTYWAASASDTALEQVILDAASIVPSSAPHFQELLRHELPPPSPRLEGDVPPLQAFAAPAWQARRSALRSKVRSSSHVLVQDMRNLQGNLHKIPAFVRRRVATWRSQRSGT